MTIKIPKLDRRELRHFGLIMGAVIAVLFGLILPWIWGHHWPRLPWIIAGVFAFLGIALPKSLQPVYQIWMRFGLVLGWINTRIILGLIFWGIVTPMGLVMRLFKRDPMTRKLEDRIGSYRLASQTRTVASMERPY